jgi:hypothetical protein
MAILMWVKQVFLETTTSVARRTSTIFNTTSFIESPTETREQAVVASAFIASWYARWFSNPWHVFENFRF